MTNAVPRQKRRYQKYSVDSDILSQNLSKFQQYRSSELSNYGKHCRSKRNYKRLIQAVRDKRLTESLEALDEFGLADDLALFILGEVVACGVHDD
ncbi:hypothetical protein NIES2100_79750 (plasmid) [Calothrix sp. NIES-2100]|uniref:hypothetical protein n=1 Tax=Calothrix sp. NIES-2100 TaxID=1954172 RepID=UPI000B5F67D3|nr:hypothetical protein NIES2100_79750 [Calothrix sp. NIES-2100]